MSSKKWKKDQLTEEDISKVLEIKDKNDVFSEEYDDFWFHKSEEDSDSESNASSVVHENEPYEEVSVFSQHSVPHGVARPAFEFLGVKWTECRPQIIYNPTCLQIDIIHLTLELFCRLL